MNLLFKQTFCLGWWKITEIVVKVLNVLIQLKMAIIGHFMYVYLTWFKKKKKNFTIIELYASQEHWKPERAGKWSEKEDGNIRLF